MIDDVDALHMGPQLVEFVAIELIEFDSLGDVVEIAADHIIVADDLMTVREEGIGEVAAEKPGDARNEDALLLHGSELFPLVMRGRN